MSDWIEWKGGRCPLGGDVKVDVRFSDGWEYCDDVASGWQWSSDQGAGTIVAYRLSDAAKVDECGALGTQISGDHYLGMKIQPVEYIFANNMDFLQGSVIKYISRHELKGGKDDVEKAIHFCKLILELQYGEGK